MVRERWRWNGRRMVRVRLDEAPRLRGDGLQVIRDIDPYMSPLGTGEVGSRRARREELKRHNCVEVEPSMHPSRFKGPTDDGIGRLVDRIFRHS